MPEREIPKRANRHLAAAAFFGLLAAGSLAIALAGARGHFPLLLAGCLVLPPCTAFAVGFLFASLDRMPGLILLDQGLFDNAFLFPAGAVPWEDIAACHLRTRPPAGATGPDSAAQGQNRALLVVLRDPAAFFASLPPGARLGRTMTLFALRKTIVIPDGFLAADLDEVRAEIQARLDQRPPIQ